MRSGISHLKKRVESERPQETFETWVEGETAANATLRVAPVSELEEPRWSVVSFDQCEAGGLTYDQAVKLMSELDAHQVTGLCIVTDDAARRMQ